MSSQPTFIHPTSRSDPPTIAPLPSPKPADPHEDGKRWRLYYFFVVSNLAAALALFGLVIAFDLVELFMKFEILTQSYLTGMAVAFLFAIYVVERKARQTSAELNYAHQKTSATFSLAGMFFARSKYEKADINSLREALRTRLQKRLSLVKLLSSFFFIVGLIGTVLGFIIAFSGVDPELAREVEAVSPMVAQLIVGMEIALYTTLLGSLFGLWMLFMYLLLSNGTSTLYCVILERHVRR